MGYHCKMVEIAICVSLADLILHICICELESFSNYAGIYILAIRLSWENTHINLAANLRHCLALYTTQ